MKTKLLLFMAILAGFASNAQIVHLTGAGVGGWNNPPLAQNLMSTTDNVNYTLSNVQITGSGGSAEFKFMVNSDWGTTFGYSTLTGAPGALWQSGFAAGPGGGTNISGVAGFWNVAYNLTTGAYSFTPGVNPNVEISLTGANNSLLTTTNGTNYSLRSITFLTPGTYSFSQTGSGNVWGNAAFPSGTATLGGAPINVPAGTYNVTFDRTTGAYAFTITSVGILGFATPSGNFNTDTMLTSTDGIIHTINNLVLTSDIMLFRDNQSWDFKFGVNGPASSNTWPGGVASPGGNDLLAVAGTYNVTFNRSTGAYNFEDVSLANSSFKAAKFIISPNPTSSTWKFSSTTEVIKTIQITDVTGKIVATTNENIIDASTLNAGIYFARIATNNAIETVKLVKN